MFSSTISFRELVRNGEQVVLPQEQFNREIVYCQVMNQTALYPSW
jgi:hypothetical protein